MSQVLPHLCEKWFHRGLNLVLRVEILVRILILESRWPALTQILTVKTLNKVGISNGMPANTTQALVHVPRESTKKLSFYFLCSITIVINLEPCDFAAESHRQTFYISDSHEASAIAQH